MLAGWLAEPAQAQDEAAEFDEAVVLAELNDTDGDLGFHALADGEDYKRLKIIDPRGRVILNVRANGRLARQGLTELFFESAEPSFDERTPAQFFRRFPQGRYQIEARTLEGGMLRSVARLTHLLPAPPGNVMVSGIESAESCDDEPLPAVPLGAPVTIAWDPVLLSHPTIGRTNRVIEVVNYEVVVELELEELDQVRVYKVDLPPEVTEVTVAEEFIDLGSEFKFEIVVREASGNQTATESCFVVGDG